jgi:hypothetical protein
MSAKTIERFYRAFAALDEATMSACYAEDAVFDDEAFSLQGRAQIGAMWAMLCQGVRSQPAARAFWRLEASAITERSAHWEPHYLFGPKARPVHNVIDAEFSFTPGGLIARHRDRFDLWRWSRQALGAPGWLMGWSPLLRMQVRARAAAQLQRHLERQTRS